jgi:hypothetical protein
MSLPKYYGSSFGVALSANVWTKSGMIENCSKVSIFAAIPWLRDSTCFLMYLMKASADQHHISIVVYTGVPVRNIPMAPPEWFECIPTFSGWKLKFL